MALPMVHIRNVMVLMDRAGMFVRMRMRFGKHSFVLVLMMFVVNVQMLMKHDPCEWR
jgi:hypothetical protein